LALEVFFCQGKRDLLLSPMKNGGIVTAKISFKEWAGGRVLKIIK